MHTNNTDEMSISSSSDIENQVLEEDTKLSETINNAPSASDKDISEVEAFAQLCAICLEPYAAGKEKVSWSKHQVCTHAFHKKCIESWLNESTRDGSCPCCRGPYLKQKVLEEIVEVEENVQSLGVESGSAGEDTGETTTTSEESNNNNDDEEDVGSGDNVSTATDEDTTATTMIEEQGSATTTATTAKEPEFSSFCIIHGLIKDEKLSTDNDINSIDEYHACRKLKRGAEVIGGVGTEGWEQG